ncbi:ABC transporter permease [Streptomycetaceae bacterium NBC_01309]
MNLFKRAWWRLTAHLGRTALVVALFTVVCTLVLSGLLIRSAVSRASASAKESVGALATMQFDLNAAIANGKLQAGNGPAGGSIGDVGNLYTNDVDKIAKSPGVQQHNYVLDNTGAGPTGGIKLYQPVPTPAGAGGPMSDFFSVSGVLDSAQLSPFRNGESRIVAGNGIDANTSGNAVLVERRLADANGLKVGDKVRLAVNMIGAANQNQEIEFTVVGVYKSDTPSGDRYIPPMADPANLVYTTLSGATQLNGAQPGPRGAQISQATFKLSSPDPLAALKSAAEEAGLDPAVFPLTLNDKQYQAMTGPIEKTAQFATITVWLVSFAGLGVIALIVAAQVRDRRRELGILMAMGERKPRLLGQQLVEVAACAVLAVGLSTAISPALSEAVGGALLSDQVDSASSAAADDPASRLSQVNGGAPSAGEQAGEAEPIDELNVRLGAGDITTVGAAGLGIAALATALPGVSLMRLKPNEILAKGE